MKAVLWSLAVIFSFGFAYTMQFTAATLALGRELSETDSRTGFQNAITPPWQTNLAMIIYIGSIIVIGLVWFQLGWLSALGALALIFVGSLLAKIVLPKTTGDHYKNLILQSMCSRYADFVRDGDALRADAMKQLLIKAGINPDFMKGA